MLTEGDPVTVEGTHGSHSQAMLLVGLIPSGGSPVRAEKGRDGTGGG